MFKNYHVQRPKRCSPASATPPPRPPQTPDSASFCMGMVLCVYKPITKSMAHVQNPRNHTYTHAAVPTCAAVLPIFPSMNISRSIQRYAPKPSASIRPTVVLPDPIIPTRYTFTPCRGGVWWVGGRVGGWLGWGGVFIGVDKPHPHARGKKPYSPSPECAAGSRSALARNPPRPPASTPRWSPSGWAGYSGGGPSR